MSCNRLFFIGVVLVVLVPLILLMAVLIHSEVIVKEQQRAVANATAEAVQQAYTRQFGAQLVARCQSPDMTVSAGFPAFEAPPRLLVLETGSAKVHGWHTSQPNGAPQSPGEVDLILCAPAQGVGEQVEVEVCTYSGISVKVPRYRVDPQVALLLPSGETVAVTTLTGATPPACPSRAYLPRGRRNRYLTPRDIIGGLPDSKSAWDWIDQIATATADA